MTPANPKVPMVNLGTIRSTRRLTPESLEYVEHLDAAWSAIVAKVGPEAAQAALHPEEVFRVRPRIADGEIV